MSDTPQRWLTHPAAPLGLVLLGLLLGAVISLQPLLAPLPLLVLPVGVFFVQRPSLLMVLIFAAILFDQVGVTGMQMDEFPVTLSKLAVLGSLAAWGARVALSRARPLRWHPVLSAMLALVLVTAVGVALTGTMKVGKFNLAGLAMMTVLVSLVYTILADSPLQPIYRLKGGIFVGALAMAVLNARLSGGRGSGTMGDPNEWATMVLMLTPLLVGGLADDEHPIARPLRTAMLLLAPLAILLSMSRTALAVGVIIAPVVLLLLRHRRAELWSVVGIAVVATPLAVDLDSVFFRVRQLIQNVQGGAVVRDVSLEERSELLRQGVQVFWDHWLIGAGPGNGPAASGYVSLTGRLRPVHNTYLEIASEQGILGLLFVALFLGTVGHTLLLPCSADRHA